MLRALNQVHSKWVIAAGSTRAKRGQHAPRALSGGSRGSGPESEPKEERRDSVVQPPPTSGIPNEVTVDPSAPARKGGTGGLEELRAAQASKPTSRPMANKSLSELLFGLSGASSTKDGQAAAPDGSARTGASRVQPAQPAQPGGPTAADTWRFSLVQKSSDYVDREAAARRARANDETELPDEWLATHSTSIHAFGKHPHDAGRAPGGSVPRLTPEWWNRVLLANDPTEGLRAVARRSLARDAKGKRLEPSLWWMEEMVRIKWYHRATRAPCAPRAGASFTAAARQGVG